MPRRWSLGVDRIPPDPLDGEYDRLKKVAKAHELHDSSREAKAARRGRSSDDVSGATSTNANSPQKRGWRR
jgi:hypothetical protein